MRQVFSVLAILVASSVAFAEVTTIPVTKDNQKAAGVEFTLTTDEHSDPTLDTVFVKLVLAKKEKHRFDEIMLVVKDGDVLSLRVPLALKQEKDSWVGTFHMTPGLARNCEIRFRCPPIATAVTYYDIQLGTYLPK